VIPVEDPESIPLDTSPDSRARSASPARAKPPTPTRSSHSLVGQAKTDTAASLTGGASAYRLDMSSSPSKVKATRQQQEREQGSLVAVRAKTDAANSPTVVATASRQDKSSIASSLSKAKTAAPAKEEIFVDNESRRDVEELMSRLQDGSRVAIYWPLDAAYYEGTVEDRLQDNFFYVRYDDGESEWLGTCSF
jgi:hypothetical protein